jgi:beta-glucosidase
VDDAGVTFTLENTGDVEGAEVAQLYVGRASNGVHRPARELKGFRKVRLAPGETATVTIPFDERTFRHYSVAQGGWSVEAGEYWIGVGASVEDIRGEATLRVEGEAAAVDRRADLPSYYSGQVAHGSDAEFEVLLGRELPAHTEARGPLHANSPLLAMHQAPSPLARLAAKVLRSLIDRSQRRGKPDLNLFFLYNMPFRAIGKMTNGAVSMEMVDAIVTLVNGKHLRGIGGVVSGFFRNRRESKRLAAELASTASAPASSPASVRA